MPSRVYIHLILLLAAHPVAAVAGYNFQFVVNATKSLYDIFHFETFVVFRNVTAAQRYVRGPSLEQALHRLFVTPLICLNGDTPATMRLRTTLNKNGLGFVIMDRLTDPIRHLADAVLTKIHSLKLIFILTEPAANVSESSLSGFFSWCWHANLLDIVLTHASNDGRNVVFTYNPFPDRIQIMNLTSAPVSGYFWNKVANVMGHKFATPVFVDEPLVMKVHDKKTNTTTVTGPAGRLYKEFLRHINGTFFLLQLSNGSLHLHQKRVVQLTTDKVIDVSIHPFTYLLPYETDGSYPIAHTNACIILPVVPEIDRGYYVIYAFSQQMWLIMVALFLAFLAVQLIANYTRVHELLVGRSMQSTLAGMINQPAAMFTPAKSEEGRWRTRAVMHVLLVFTGFLVSNLYVAALTSLFSTTVYGTQPETVDDILRTGLEFLLLDYEETAFFKTKLFPSELQKRVRVTDPDTQASYRNKLDTSFAYIVKEERWKMIDYQQSRLWKPIFKIAQDFCIPNMFLSFPIQFDSPFYEVLKTFTLWADSAGLYLLWSALSSVEAKDIGMIEVLNETKQHPVPLTLEHFKMVFTLVSLCFLLCFGCFLGEHYAAWVRRRKLIFIL